MARVKASVAGQAAAEGRAEGEQPRLRAELAAVAAPGGVLARQVGAAADDRGDWRQAVEGAHEVDVAVFAEAARVSAGEADNDEGKSE